MKITREEMATLRYFWEQKGDLSRYTGWDDLVPELERQFPEIIRAWNDYVAARRILTAVLRYTEQKVERNGD